MMNAQGISSNCSYEVQENMQHNSTSGAPHRGLRPGQIDWVAPIKSKVEWRQWAFEFQNDAAQFLSTSVYPRPDERKLAWITCLIRAARQGGFDEMRSDIALLSSQGYACEALFAELERQYTKGSFIQQQQAQRKLFTLSRGNSTLLEAMNKLQKALAECRMFGYHPDDSVISMVTRGLLREHEMLLGKIRAGSDDTATGFIKVLQDMAVEIESLSDLSRRPDRATPTFAGVAFDKKPRRKGWRAGDRAESGAPPGHGCSNCGGRHGAEESCPASGRPCHGCGKLGHFERMCRSRGANDAKSANTVASRQEGQHSASGF